MSEYKIDFRLKPWEEPIVGVRMKVHEGAGLQLRLVEFTRGFVEQDWCMRGHVGYVLDGRLEVTFRGTTEFFEAGDGVFIPAGETHKHRARVLTDTTTLVLVENTDEPSGGGDGIHTGPQP